MPVDKLDNACRIHDFNYEHGDKRMADKYLADEAWDQMMRGNLTALPIWWYFHNQAKPGEGNYVVPPSLVGDDTITDPGFDPRDLTEGRWINDVSSETERLVGVEPNPGPKKMKKQALVKYKANPVSRSLQQTYRASKSDVHVEVGRSRLGNIVTGGIGDAGTIVFQIDLAPAMINGRLEKFSSMYARYRFLGAKLVYTPTVATSAVGQLIITYDNDVTLWPNSTQTSVQDETQKRVNVEGSIRDICTLTIPPTSDLLYTNTDAYEPRTGSPGFVLVVAGTTLATSTSLGVVSIEYAYEFSRAVANPSQQLGFMLQGATASSLSWQKPVSASDALVNLFPLSNIGQQTLAGDNVWKTYIDAHDSWIRIPPYTNFAIHLALKGTGIGDLYSSTVGITWNKSPVTSTSATDLYSSLSGYSSAKTGFLKVFLSTCTTLTNTLFIFARIEWDATLSAVLLGDVEEGKEEIRPETNVAYDSCDGELILVNSKPVPVLAGKESRRTETPTRTLKVK